MVCQAKKHQGETDEFTFMMERKDLPCDVRFGVLVLLLPGFSNSCDLEIPGAVMLPTLIIKNIETPEHRGETAKRLPRLIICQNKGVNV